MNNIIAQFAKQIPQINNDYSTNLSHIRDNFIFKDTFTPFKSNIDTISLFITKSKLLNILKKLRLETNPITTLSQKIDRLLEQLDPKTPQDKKLLQQVLSNIGIKTYMDGVSVKFSNRYMLRIYLTPFIMELNRKAKKSLDYRLCIDIHSLHQYKFNKIEDLIFDKLQTLADDIRETQNKQYQNQLIDLINSNNIIETKTIKPSDKSLIGAILNAYNPKRKDIELHYIQYAYDYLFYFNRERLDKLLKSYNSNKAKEFHKAEYIHTLLDKKIYKNHSSYIQEHSNKQNYHQGVFLPYVNNLNKINIYNKEAKEIYKDKSTIEKEYQQSATLKDLDISLIRFETTNTYIKYNERLNNDINIFLDTQKDIYKSIQKNKNALKKKNYRYTKKGKPLSDKELEQELKVKNRLATIRANKIKNLRYNQNLEQRNNQIRLDLINNSTPIFELISTNSNNTTSEANTHFSIKDKSITNPQHEGLTDRYTPT